MPFDLVDTVRHTINHHFRRRKNFEWTEEFFLNAISLPRSKYDVYYSVLGLRAVGSTRAISALKGLLGYPMSDVKTCAILTVAQIARSEETEFYAATLLSSKYRDKGYAMWAIEDAADERAIPAVIEYLQRNMRKIRKSISKPMSQHEETLLHAARYLRKFSNSSEQARDMLNTLAALSAQVADMLLPSPSARGSTRDAGPP